MKAFTKNLLYFAILFLFGAIVFRYGLSSSFEFGLDIFSWVLGTIYFVYNFILGWVFGKRDYESLPLYDIGIRFHFVTFLLHNLVSILWFQFDLQYHNENIDMVYISASYWGIFLFIHFIFYLLARKHTINGISKEEIFE